MIPNADGRPASDGRLWRLAWLALAAIYALPVGWRAYDRVTDVTYKARAQLIMQYQLWELQPEYKKGSHQNWTRFASRLLTDRQLMTRVRARHGELAAQIETDYRSQLTIAQAEVVIVALALWAAPLAVLYALGIGIARLRRRAVPEKPRPASHSDSRYRM